MTLYDSTVNVDFDCPEQQKHGFVIVKPQQKFSVSDLAMKAFLLELTFGDISKIRHSDDFYLGRKSEIVEQTAVTLQVEGIINYCAATTIQCYIRLFMARRKAHEARASHSTRLVWKINELATKGLHTNLEKVRHATSCSSEKISLSLVSAGRAVNEDAENTQNNGKSKVK